MKPSIGRIVHFVQATVLGDCVHLPAIVVSVWDDNKVNLQVFTDDVNSEGNDPGRSAIKWVPYVVFDDSATPQPRTWHWPEREETSKQSC